MSTNNNTVTRRWFGQPECATPDFIMVFVHEGLGAGIVFDRQVYRGASGAAGEFGHMIIGREAPTACSSSSFDCWKAFASGRAAVARYGQLTNQNIDLSQLSFRQLIDRAITGEVKAQKALLETARNLSIGISNLISFMKFLSIDASFRDEASPTACAKSLWSVPPERSGDGVASRVACFIKEAQGCSFHLMGKSAPASFGSILTPASEAA